MNWTSRGASGPDKTGVLSGTLRRRAAGRRRLLAAVAAGGCAVGAMTMGLSPAFAVHDNGIFQLDGNAQTSVQSTPPAADDWDNVCHVAAPAICPTGGTLASTNTAAAFINDGAHNASIFTGGGSKDPLSLTGWAWKDQLGGLPDKDNLADSFAARYNASGQQLLYFGSDRFDNSGDAQEGFWFFQNQISLNAANGTFTGVHKDGDLLILSDFSNGGSTSTINIYRWTGTDAAGSLTFLTGGATAKCGGSANDTFCGIVNPTDGTPAPWPFLDKSGKTTFLNGEFYEGGVNLSDPSINLGNECFSSFASETRSSTSTTATLKDFVLGQFAQCSATLSTAPSAGMTDATAVSPGTPVTDTATVQGRGSTTAPTGTVTFSYCGPTDPASTTLCVAPNGTSAGSGTLSPTAVTAQATATSGQINTSANPLLPGRYCFRASYAGDTNYPAPLNESGTGNSECFLVRQIATTTVTTPSDGSGVALKSPVALGTSLFDNAVVTGNSVGGSPPGTVDFFYCDPNHLTGAAGAETCPVATGTALSGNHRTLVAGANNTSSVLSSPAVVANIAGVWCFSATYNPSGSTYLSSSDATHGECVTVNPSPTTTVTTPQVNGTPAVNDKVTDHAVITGTAAGGPPTGTVNFFICDPTQVTANGGTCITGTGNPAGSVTAAAVANTFTSTADSAQVTANTVGTWCFRAEYVSNTVNYTNSSDASSGECFTVKDTTTAASAQDWLPNDSAAITSAGGTALDGTLSFTLYSGTGCAAGTQLRAPETFTLKGEASGTTHSTTNTTVKVSSNASTSWLVTFTSTNPLVGSSSHCESTTLTIVN